MWKKFIENEEKKDYFIKLKEFVKEEYKNNICHPDYDNIFNAFKYSSYEDIKVVILGQDPYHGYNQAHGLSFSVLCEKLPPSLKNIYKEMSNDLGVEVKQDGNLDYLAKQGVFLLNTILTVRDATPMSHKDKGWEIFTDNVIKYLNDRKKPMVFILWGAPASKKASMITNPNHLILTSSHPSPLGAYRGFIGSKPFSKTNEFLKSNNIKEITWVKESHIKIIDII